MAKGNMLQGMARGKVGDVVFSRLNGQQISRVRNRQPYNPRTNKQLIQRAIMASIMLAYSAGKEIFNHSFQGKAVGAANQREFMRLNAKNLRSIIANDLNNGIALASQVGRVVAPRAISPVACPLIISAGSYEQKFFSWQTAETSFGYPQANQDETCAHYCERVGLVPGDIYTYVAFSFDAPDNEGTVEKELSYQKEAVFTFVRLQVKENALEDNTAIGANLAKYEAQNGTPFIITEQKTVQKVETIDFDPTFGLIIRNMGAKMHGYAGIIRSRKDSDLRSNSEMYTDSNSVSTSTLSGIASQYIAEVWGAGATPVGDSDLILEGGDI